MPHTSGMSKLSALPRGTAQARIEAINRSAADVVFQSVHPGRISCEITPAEVAVRLSLYGDVDVPPARLPSPEGV